MKYEDRYASFSKDLLHYNVATVIHSL